MKVYVAETGRNFDIQFGPLDHVEELSQQLALKTGISIRDQILICSSGTKLDSRYTLKSYNLDDKEVFLFNRQALTGVTPSEPTFIKPEEYDFTVPRTPPISREDDDHPLRTHKTIVYRSFPEFERTFKHHCEIARSYHTGGSERLKACEVSFAEQQVQKNSLDAVMCNLKSHTKHCTSSCTKFFAVFEEQETRHRRVLDSFESKLAELLNYELHSVLRNSSRTTLLDFVDESDLRRHASDCAHYHEQIKQKVLECRELSESLVKKIEHENSRKAPFDHEFLSEHYKKASDVLSLEVQSYQDLVKDYNDVGLTIETIVKGQETVDAHELVKEYEIKNGDHENSLAHLRKLDEKLRISIEIFGNSQRDLSQFFYSRLTSVAELQSKMRDLQNTIIVYTETLSRKEEMFEKLAAVENIPSAYEAALAEIARRRCYGRQFINEASSIAERLSSWRDKEAARRERFAKKYSKYIPGILAKCLEDRPAYCDIHTGEFDIQLPEIDSYKLKNEKTEQSSSQFHLSDSEGEEEYKSDDDLPNLEKGNLIISSPDNDPSSSNQSSPYHQHPSSGSDRYNKSMHNLQRLQNENEYLKSELALHEVSCDYFPRTAQQRKDETSRRVQQEIEKFREDLEKSHCFDMSKQRAEMDESKALYESQIHALEGKITNLTEENENLAESTDNLLAEREQQEREKTQLSIILEKKQVDLEKENNELKTSNFDLRASFDTIRTQANNDRIKFEEQWQKKLEMEQSNSQNLQKAIDEISESNEKLVAEMTTEREQLLKKIREISEKANKLETELKTFKNEEKDAISELKAAQREMESMRIENERMAINSAVFLRENKENKEKIEELRRKASTRISFENMNSGDVILFYKNDKGHFVAYSQTLNHRYLALESRSVIFQHREDSDDQFILGRLVFSSEKVASRDNGCNPFDLDIGTEYHELVVEHIKHE